MSGVLKGKVAIITGSSRGFGKVFALRFAEEGAKLLLTTTSLERAQGTVQEVEAKGGEVAMIEADISHEDAGKKIAEKVGKPRAYRAVANALKKNPLHPIVPCHRVVRSDGGFGGEKKRAEARRELVKKEGIPIEDGRVKISEDILF